MTIKNVSKARLEKNPELADSIKAKNAQLALEAKKEEATWEDCEKAVKKLIVDTDKWMQDHPEVDTSKKSQFDTLKGELKIDELFSKPFADFIIAVVANQDFSGGKEIKDDDKEDKAEDKEEEKPEAEEDKAEEKKADEKDDEEEIEVEITDDEEDVIIKDEEDEKKSSKKDEDEEVDIEAAAEEEIKEDVGDNIEFGIGVADLGVDSLTDTSYRTGSYDDDDDLQLPEPKPFTDDLVAADFDSLSVPDDSVEPSPAELLYDNPSVIFFN